MSRPVRTTIVFALLSGLLVVPGSWLMQRVLPWPMALKLTLWADLALYAVLLARWSGTPLIRIIFPLAILGGIAAWPQTYVGFFILAPAMLSWIRSGICYRGTPVRAVGAEVLTVAGAGALVLLSGGWADTAWSLDIGLFILVQALYFFIMPAHRSGQREKAAVDPFERAMAGAAKVLEDHRAGRPAG